MKYTWVICLTKIWFQTTLNCTFVAVLWRHYQHYVAAWWRPEFQTCVVRLSNDVTIMMFDLHAAIRSWRVLFSISNAFMKLGSSQLRSFSAFTAKKKASEMLINNLTIQSYPDSTLNDRFDFRTYLISIREPSSSWLELRSRETFDCIQREKVLLTT